MRRRVGAVLLFAGLAALPATGQEPPAQVVKEEVRTAPSRGRMIYTGINWLIRHQAADGSWPAAAFGNGCETLGACTGPHEDGLRTTSTTSLALLALHGEGHSERHGPFKAIVARGLKHVLKMQQEDGCLAVRQGDHWMADHAIGTFMLCEAYGLSGFSPSLKTPSRRALEFLLAAQNPGAGWGNGVKPGHSDAAVTAWAIFAIKSASLSEMKVPEAVFAGATAWLETVRETTPADREGAAAICRIFTGVKPDHPGLVPMRKRAVDSPPKWTAGSVPFEQWYFEHLAAFQLGGKEWESYSTALLEVLSQNQKQAGCAAGSWDPSPDVGTDLGRVGATALAILAAQPHSKIGRVGDPKVTVCKLNGKTFDLKDKIWFDRALTGEHPVVTLPFYSDEYFALLRKKPALGPFTDLAGAVHVLFEGVEYRIAP